MRALVLSGGAVKGAYQAGALKRWMGEDKVDYEILCGVSVGAINVSYLAQAKFGEPELAITNLLKLWSQVTNDNVRKDWTFWSKLASLWKPSVYDSSPLLKWISSGLDKQAVQDSGRKVRVGAVAWDTGEYYMATEMDPDLDKWVAASSSFPVFLLPVEIDGRMWSDGGLRNVTPLGEAIRLGATEIDVIMCSNPDRPSNWKVEGKHALPDYALRAVDIMGDEIIRADLKECGLKNDIAKLDDSYKNIKIRLLQPQQTFNISSSLDFDPKNVEMLLQIGYEESANPIIL